jgi:dTDP-L-rhamnose 4-epimerase
MKGLITGGAGFIGLAVTRHLLAAGHAVTALDNFHPQIHGTCQTLPSDIAETVDLLHGDVADREAWLKALVGQQAVLHLAADTGTGQSMYEVQRYNRANITGTALFLD